MNSETASKGATAKNIRLLFVTQNSSDLALEDSDNSLLVDYPDSPIDDLYLDSLKGETLVPNSPTPTVTEQDDMDNQNDSIVDDRGHPSACIFVANLNKFKSDEELNMSIRKKFQRWGKVIGVKVLKDWMERPYAFVQYQKTADAKQALSKAAGFILNGRRLRCEPARVNRTLAIISMKGPLDENDIRNELSAHGPIEQIQLNQSTPFPSARIKFTYRNDAINAFLHTQKLAHGRHWTVQWTENSDLLTIEERLDPNGKSVYVGNLDKTITKTELYERFTAYGPIQSAVVIKKLDPYYKTTFGFVKYASHNSANKAVFAENGQEWYGHNLRVAHRDNRRQHFPYNPSYGTTPISTHAGFPWVRPHPPGLGFSAATAATAAAYVYGGYSNSRFIGANQTTTGNNTPSSPSTLTTLTTTTKTITTAITAHQYQNEEHKGMKSFNRQVDFNWNQETRRYQQRVRPTYGYNHSDQGFYQYYHFYPYYAMEQNQQGCRLPSSLMAENHYWPTNRHPHQTRLPMTPTTTMYDANSLTYYQVYSCAGTFYFIPIATEPTPCMDSTSRISNRPHPPSIHHA